jgi:hypothetical protein
VKYRLINPVEVGGVRVEELNFRERVKVKDWKGIPVRDPMHFDDLCTIAARLCGLSDLIFGEIDHEDMAAIIALVSGFLSSGPTTTTTP